MKVLSLFDGMSCGQIALHELGIPVDEYYASEIDKYAISIAQKNFPNTIQLGDVRTIKGKDLPEIDLLMGGSPCQGFSFAGKQLNFDDPRSALFFEFLRVLKEVKPQYFLLENVRMKKEYQDVITAHMGVEPIMINSALVSAQNRVRLYWTNIPNVEQPEDRGLVLGDILDDFVEFKYYAGKQLQKAHDGGDQLNPSYRSQANTIHQTNKPSPTITAGTHGYANGYIKDDAMPKWLEMNHNGKPRIESVRTTEQKSATLLASMYKGHIEGYVKKPKQVATATDINGHDMIKRVYSGEGKSPTLTSMQGGNTQPKVSITETDKYYQMNREGAYPNQQQDRVRKAEKPSNTLTGAGSSIPNVSVAVGSRIKTIPMTEVRSDEANRIRKEHKKKTGVDWSPREMRHLVEREDDKSNSLTPKLTKQHILKEITSEDNNHVVVGIHYRKLTPMECERLQTLPDNYTDGVSNTQRYKMIGNGWTIEVIKHILSHIERE
tara:strand:+ start:1786 stop:3261 length:1476 start_codon:yes stop_codon:yes gene_type:complete